MTGVAAVADCPWYAPGREPLVVAYGVGVDSTALLIGLAQRGIVPDLILFADTGGEKPETYQYLDVIRPWLARVGFPDLVIVRRRPIKGRKGSYDTLEGNCLVNETLPGLAFGKKSCSGKWKVEPQDAYCAKWLPARQCWARGGKVLKLIGYDAGPRDKRRKHIPDDARYRYAYPLDDWGWDRERCEAEIRATGLPVPPKSACWFCPAMKPEELVELRAKHPWIPGRLRAIESAAAPKLRKVTGLWGRPTRQRPGSMTEFLDALDAGASWSPPPKASPARARTPTAPPKPASIAVEGAMSPARAAALKAWATRRARAVGEAPAAPPAIVGSIPVAKPSIDRSAAARRAWATRRAKEARAA